MIDNRPRILIVDDEPDSVQNLTDILSDQGYCVHSASDGTSALELLKHHRFFAALLDFRLPGMNGLELFREIRRSSPETVALMISACAEMTTQQSAADAGIWRFLPKPLSAEVLVSLLREALGQPLILLVDDDRELCANLWDLLHDQGYRVVLAHSTTDALESLADRHYQAVLLDLKLAGENAAKVIARLRTDDLSARTLVMTGYRRELDPLVEEAISSGVQAIFDKPIDVRALLSALKNIAGPCRRES
jgi:two-component system, NtrC family, response regulator HydG